MIEIKIINTFLLKFTNICLFIYNFLLKFWSSISLIKKTSIPTFAPSKYVEMVKVTKKCNKVFHPRSSTLVGNWREKWRQLGSSPIVVSVSELVRCSASAVQSPLHCISEQCMSARDRKVMRMYLNLPNWMPN